MFAPRIRSLSSLPLLHSALRLLPKHPPRTRAGACRAFSSPSPTPSSAGTSLVDHLGARCLCVSSWFMLPEQGMAEPELLSRASGFLVRRAPPAAVSPQWGADRPQGSPPLGVVDRVVASDEEVGAEGGQLHVVASGHVVHPFRSEP